MDNVRVREAEVREAIERRARADADPAESRFIPELNLCQSEARIDLAAVNSRLLGWEIKTVTDSLSRLPSQEEVYSRIFDRMWLVADARHLDRATDLVPPWWGIWEIREKQGVCNLIQVRRSRLNPQVDLGSLVRLLWRDEALAELARLGIADGLHRSPRRDLWNALAEASPRHISPTRLRERVRVRLRDREGWRSDEQRTSGGGSS